MNQGAGGADSEGKSWSTASSSGQGRGSSAFQALWDQLYLEWVNCEFLICLNPTYT